MVICKRWRFENIDGVLAVWSILESQSVNNSIMGGNKLIKLLSQVDIECIGYLNHQVLGIFLC